MFLLLAIRAKIPEIVNLPTFATRRNTVDISTGKGLGIEPFMLPPLEPIIKLSVPVPPRQKLDTEKEADELERVSSRESVGTMDSEAPLTPFPVDSHKPFSIRKPA